MVSGGDIGTGVGGEQTAENLQFIFSSEFTQLRCRKITISNGHLTNSIAAFTIAKYALQTRKCTARNRKLALICGIIICTVSKRILTNKRTAGNRRNVPVQNSSRIRCILIVGTIKSTARNI